MYPAEFAYHKAQSLADALAVLAAHPGAKLLAGGHSLLPAMKLRLAAPGVLIDLGGLAELRGVREDGDMLAIGAMTTHADLAASSVPLLREVAPLVGDPMVRRRDTIGGVLAHADPAADYPASLLALGGEVVIHGAGGERRVGADDFFQGMFTTQVGEGEVLTAVRVPARVEGAAYEKFAHPASRYAVVGVAVARHVGGTWQAAVTGAGAQAARLSRLEDALNADQDIPETLVDEDELLGDRFASAEYRAHLVSVLAKRAVARVRGGAQA